MDDDEVLLNERRSGSPVKPHLLFGTTGYSGFLKLVVLFFLCVCVSFLQLTPSDKEWLYNYANVLHFAGRDSLNDAETSITPESMNAIRQLKGHYVVLETKLKLRFNFFNINVIIRQTQTYLFFP